jgi:hypothetical protein
LIPRFPTCSQHQPFAAGLLLPILRSRFAAIDSPQVICHGRFVAIRAGGSGGGQATTTRTMGDCPCLKRGLRRKRETSVGGICYLSLSEPTFGGWFGTPGPIEVERAELLGGDGLVACGVVPYKSIGRWRNTRAKTRPNLMPQMAIHSPGAVPDSP